MATVLHGIQEDFPGTGAGRHSHIRIRFSGVSSRSKNSFRFLGFAHFLVEERMRDTMVIRHTVAGFMTTMDG